MKHSHKRSGRKSKVRKNRSPQKNNRSKSNRDSNRDSIDPVPNNVSNPSLYRSIRNRMRREHKKQSKRWGAYSSGHLVKEYKKRGGKYFARKRTKSSVRKRSTASRPTNLSRWFREKWVDTCAYRSGKIKPCGRKNVRSGKFPYCRPLHRISANTPKTVKEFNKKELKNLCSRKRKNPKTIIRRRNSYHFNNSHKKIKLLSIKKSPKSHKKLRATFEVNGKKRTTDFGAAGMSDYTRHRDKERRSRYIKRHSKDLRTNDPTRAGYLSMYVLWNKPTVKQSISDYKKRLSSYNRTGKFSKKIK
jgi:hypothetical protein